MSSILSRMDLVELSKTDMPAALKALWDRIEYIGTDAGPILPDQVARDWRRDRGCAKVLLDLKNTNTLPKGFALGFTEFVEPSQVTTLVAVEGLLRIGHKGGLHPETGEPLKVGDRVVPHLFNFVASVLHLLCEQNKDLAVAVAGNIDREKAFKPGETLRILCGHGMKQEAIAHLRKLCHEDREFALNTAHAMLRGDDFPQKERLAILAEEGITPRKRGDGGASKSYVDPGAQDATLGDKLGGAKLVIGQRVETGGSSNDDSDGGSMSASAAVA